MSTTRSLTRSGRIGTVVAATAAAALVGAIVSPATASAAIELTYKVTGSAFVAKMNTEIPIDATVDVHLDAQTGEFTSEFRQDTVPHVKFKAFGAFDSELDVEFFEAAPSSGKFDQSNVTYTLPLQIKLKELTALGYPLLVGENCVQKAAPTLQLASTAPFDPAKGGNLETVEPYTLSDWSDECGFSTFLINMNSAGGNNTAKVTLAPTGQ